MRSSLLILYLYNTPFLRYLIFWVIGVLGYLLGISGPMLLLIVLGGLGLLSITRILSHLHKNTFVLAGMHLGLSMCAYLACYIHDTSNEAFFALHRPPSKAYMAIITHKINAKRYEARMVYQYHGNSWQHCSGGLVLSLAKPKALGISDTLCIMGSAEALPHTANPEAFDFKAYYAHRGVHMQAYVLDKDILKHQPRRGFSLKGTADDLRAYLAQRLKEHLPTAAIASIAEALILGTRAEISKDLVQAYTTTGTIHVLAVSGMHVGLLFAMVTWAFSRFLHTKYRWAYVVFGLVCMWIYALLTGFSASVLRAATMYTVLQLGFLSGRKINMANTLFASSFILLACQPFMLLDIGFQLSFFAVLGIVGFQPLFENMYSPTNKLKVLLWSLVSVSMSAQLGVLPISLLYFKQFPNTFIISNLVLVTLSTMALYVGLACLACLAWVPLLKLLSTLLGSLIKLMNYSAVKLSMLPYATSHVYIDLWEALLLGGLLVLIVAGLKLKSVYFLKGTLFLFFVLSCKFAWGYYQIHTRQKVVFYSNKHAQVIDIYDRGKLLRLSYGNAPKADFRSVLLHNALANTLTLDTAQLTVKSATSLYFSVQGTNIQLITHDKVLPRAEAHIVYLTCIPPCTPTYKDILWIVPRQRMVEVLRERGYRKIHSLESQGALVL